MCNGRMLMQGGKVAGEEEIVAEARKYAVRFRK
jgi:hypothetical protein